MDRIDELELSGLRSGRDEFSKMNLPALILLRPQEAAQIAELLPTPAEQAAALRWVLRGLSEERAVAKVLVDRERDEKIRDERRKKKAIREILGE